MRVYLAIIGKLIVSNRVTIDRLALISFSIGEDQGESFTDSFAAVFASVSID